LRPPVVDNFSDRLIKNPKIVNANPELHEWHTETYHTRLPGLKWGRTWWLAMKAGGQPGYGTQAGVVDLVQKRCEAVAGRQGRRVVAHFVGDHHRGPHQLGPGLGAEGVGGRQQLAEPRAGLARVVAQYPEGAQHPEQVRQRIAVMGKVPAYGGGQVARLGLQPFGPLALADAPQRPVSPFS
jgi:hypothetical protein